MEVPAQTLDAFLQPKHKAHPTRGAPHLFLAIECERPAARPVRWCLSDVDAVHVGRGNARSAQRDGSGAARALHAQVPDPWMSKAHARIHRVAEHWVFADEGSKNGSVVNGARTTGCILADGDLLELGHTLFIFREALPASPDLDAGTMELVPGLSTVLPQLADDLSGLERIARSATPLIVYGDSGTGKELIARAVHRLSGRPGRFVAVNCGAMPDTLIETELFGYRKGAFSGANEDRPGLVRAADAGTLFLDEVVDLPLAAQGALLRVLQENEVMPVGATRPLPVDLRVVVASQARLEPLADSGKFRPDFFARIAGFTLSLPRLADRREDIGLLLPALLERVHAKPEMTFSCEAARALFRYSWPLNIRELERCIETAVVLAGDGPVDLPHLPANVRENAPPHHAPVPQLAPRPGDEEKREELLSLLREHHGNVTAVAKAMGKARMQVQRWLKRFQIDPESFRR